MDQCTYIIFCHFFCPFYIFCYLYFTVLYFCINDNEGVFGEENQLHKAIEKVQAEIVFI